MSSRPPNSPNLSGPLAAVGVGLLMVVCCAGPVLLAAGGLSVLGAALHHPWLIVGAAVVVLAAVGLTVRGLAKTSGSRSSTTRRSPWTATATGRCGDLQRRPPAVERDPHP
jgi:hypothetical protein